MARNSRLLQEYSNIPDTRLKDLYGDAEKRRHYINLEYFGNDPLNAISPDLHTTERQFGTGVLMRAGILPWTIDQVSTELAAAWESGNCTKVLLLSGYLSHYVGDLSQPLHTTRSFDGLVQADRGVHARFELAVDHAARDLGDLARPQVHIMTIDSVWKTLIEGLRESNKHVAEVVEDDRAARASSDSERAYERAMMERAEAMAALEIARSASILTSIWLYEWNQAGHPASCARAAAD